MNPQPKSILITGCSLGGIGDYLAQEFHKRGCKVFATSRDLEKIKHLKHLGLEVLQLDVADEKSLRASVESVARETGGGLDVLVNNAGIACSMPLLDVSIQDARKTFDTNFFGVLATIQAFAPLLIKAKGRIVNISSVAQFTPVPWLGVYNCSKAAVGMLSDNLRLEMAPFGVKVICVITGGVETNIYDNQLSSPLPETSVFNPAKEEIEKIMAGSVSKKFLAPAKGVAEKIVRNALSARPSVRVFTGDKATSLWALNVFGWHTIWDYAFSWLYGLMGFEKLLKVQERMGKESKESGKQEIRG